MKDNYEQKAGYLLALLISNKKLKIFTHVYHNKYRYSVWQLQRSTLMEKLTHFDVNDDMWWEYTDDKQTGIFFGLT